MSDEIIENDQPIEAEESHSEAEQSEIESSGEETAEAVENLSSEDQSDLQDAVEEAIEGGATEEQVQEMIEEFVLKVNGKEVIKKIDLNDKEAIKNELQMAHAGRGAMQRSRELEKAYEDALADLRNRPLDVLSELGLDVDQLTKGHLEAQIEEMKKSPEQLAQEKYEKDLQAAREAERKYKEELERVQYEQLLAEEDAALEKDITGALDAYTSLPDSPMVRQKIAETMVWAIENGYDDVSAKDVLPTVEKELQKQQEEFFGNMPVEFIERFLGKRNIEKMRENRIAKAKTTPTSQSVTETAKEPKKEEKKRKKMTAKEYFKSLG